MVLSRRGHELQRPKNKSKYLILSYMTVLESILRRASSDLKEIGAPFALVGGIAVGIHSQPRTTQDADFTVAVGSDHSAEQIVHKLVQRNYQILETLERKPDGYLSTVRLLPPEHKNDAMVDLLFASSGIENEITQAAQDVTVLGMTLKVARKEHLLVMKLLSQDLHLRPTDITDIYALIDCTDEKELDEARHLTKLITKRGYHRRRDLPGDLERFVKLAHKRRESGEFF